ncbi:TetR/AcrR family transcriptional regulator [Aeromicrobium sp. Leaf350]|uniref:TetR/AcrR family transcriptional regulator n=1 Tax=Aeromicrobium sp. Leaf350 TaxID=2876565 RepID=UPI001E4AAB9C|nr:TetR/AcrR family transcriptional regulator [Aeromicrobium sp. Leaf350]
MPRATAAAAAETARTVLRTATDLFVEQGVAAVSLDQVARVAGVTRGAVTHHFGSKSGMVRAVAAALQSDVAAAVVAAAQEQPDPLDQLRSGSHAFLDAVTAGPSARLLLVEVPAVIGWAEWRALDAAASEAHLRDALTGCGVVGPDLDAATAQLSGAMNEAALRLADRPDDPALRDAMHAVLDRLIDAVVGEVHRPG